MQGSRRVFELRDDRIFESSGLADLGSLMATVNDSGDTSRVFVLDPESGETVGVTDFHTEVTDVEALAPAGPRAVYVGDIGDNDREREEVVVHRVPVGRGQLDVEPASFRLAYPDGPHDAESLFADRAGRLHLITKSFRGGTVYRAPKQLQPSGVNVLEPVGRVRGYVTDAALLRGGRYLLVRSLQQATVYSMPDLEPVGSFALPWQPQGEGVSVGPDGRIRISTEGAGTPVYEVQLPAAVARTMRNPQAPTASASPERRRPTRRRGRGGCRGSGPGHDLAGVDRRGCARDACHRGGRGVEEEVEMRVIAVQGDITTQDVDAVVNAANRRMRGGGGVDGAIHRAGGPAVLEDCRRRFPDGLATGQAGWTTAGQMPARWVIHVVGPNFSAGERDRSLLTSCYASALAVADELGARTIAFPLVSAGIYGWPREDAVAAAVETLSSTETQVEEARIVAYDAAGVRAGCGRSFTGSPVKLALPPLCNVEAASLGPQ